MKQRICITRKGSVSKINGAADLFTGNVSVELSIPRQESSTLSGALVTFSPKARTNWHTHPCGQLLIIVEGKGYVQEAGQPIQEVSQGDLVWFPAGVKHWHGGTQESSLSHYALAEEYEGSVVQWMEAVTDEEYAG